MWASSTLAFILYFIGNVPTAISQSTPASDVSEATLQTEKLPSSRSSIIDAARQRMNCTSDQSLVDFKCIDKDLKGNNSSLLQLFFVAGISVCWVLYLTYFNSRVIGFILTRILNPFYKDGHIKFGSFTFSVLSGKVMFRDLQFISPDLSLRIYDGYCIFRWWRPYKFSPWRKKRDLNQGHTRLSVVLYGVEYHVYNRSQEYLRLEKLFGLSSNVFEKKSGSAAKKPSAESQKESSKVAWWRSLIPVIKFSIAYGKIIFGNKLLPSTLVVPFEDAAFQYKTTKASNHYDLFMHALEGSLGTARFMLVPSSKYDPGVLPPHLQGQVDDVPPRKMSEGFDLINCNHIRFKYIWDEPGRTNRPLEQSKFCADQSSSDETTSPCSTDESPVWELEVRCKRRTTLNYGPWADRQILQLWRFFYPIDYQNLEVTPACEDGKPRAATSFKMYLNLLHESDIDLLFLKNNETNAIHVNLKKGSCIKMHVPMVVGSSGFVSEVSGDLLFPEATTSMLYRPLLTAETLSFNINAHYPIRWNENQLWDCNIKATKATASLVFAHKNFIADLMDDWSSKDPPDLLQFSPYKMKFNFDLQGFELLLPANEHNWVDCATKRKENALVGLCGSSLAIGFTLPFDSFLAPMYTIPFHFLIKRAELCLFLPPSNPSRNILLNLSKGVTAWNIGDRKSRSESCVSDIPDGQNGSVTVIHKDPAWGLINHEWVKCWDAPEMDLTISYTWHPILCKPKEEFKGSLSSKEMERAEKAMQRQSSKTSKTTFHKRSSVSASDSALDSGDVAPLLFGTTESIASSTRMKNASAGVTFDPTTLDPDEIKVEFFLKPGSTLYLYGSLLHHFIAIKENYLGVDDLYTDFTDGQQEERNVEKDTSDQTNDPLYYRTLQVTVNVNLHDIHGVLPIHPNPALKSYPTVRLKRLTFEMDKNYNQTRLQLLLSKLVVTTEESGLYSQSVEGRKGWLTLLDLQLRGHAMFSGEGLPMGAVTIEYGWLTEVLVGSIIGNLTVPQIQCMAQWVQSFVFMFKNSTHEMKPAYPKRYLPTGITWDYKKQDGSPISEEDVKFLMLQVKLESILLHAEENDSVLDVAVSPVIISNGNVQFPGVKEAASIRVQEVVAKLRMKRAGNSSELPGKNNKWMETGEVRFGSLCSLITVAMVEHEICQMQTKFLKFHDKKTRRLHFLWQEGGAVDGSTSSPNMPLSSVQALKSWGCNFFHPLTSKHPTYFYYKNKKSPPPRSTGGTFVAFDEESSSASYSSDTDSEDRDSEVFDPGMDYGMSLLAEGKCLLSRSRTQSDMLSNTHDASSSSSSSSPLVGGGDRKESVSDAVSSPRRKPVLQRQAASSEFLLDRPCLKRQGRLSGSAGSVPSMVPLKTPLPSTGVPSEDFISPEASLLRKPRSQTVDVQSGASSSMHQQVSFAPSPIKCRAVDKTNSQPDLDEAIEGSRAMKRAMSSESNLYRSAESDFKSTTSLSSAGDDFYSAESDLNESNRNSVASDSILLAASGSNLVAKHEETLPASRPGTLTLKDGFSGPVTTSSTSTLSTIPTAAKGPQSVADHSSLSPGSGECSNAQHPQLQTPSPSGRPVLQKDSVLACYESYLTLLELKPKGETETNATTADTSVDDGVNDPFYDEKRFVLPEFSVFQEGVHPSIMVDRNEEDEDLERQPRKMESSHRQLSFDDINSSGKMTSVSVHLKESLDVQMTPFVLDTVLHLLNAALPVVKNENPLAVISQLQGDCVDDVAVRIPEDCAEEEQDLLLPGIAVGKSKSLPELQRQARVEVDGSPNLSDSKAARPPPGTKLSFKMDKVRVNILQATLGDDRVFGLRTSKLLPAPCVTIMSARLDSLNVSADVNSRRKNRLLLENYRKVSQSSSGASAFMEKGPSLANMSTTSDLDGMKHFLVLLNAKADAQSVGIQLRALTCDGSVPETTSITALADRACKAPYEFSLTHALPHVKASFDRWKKGESSPRASDSQQKVNSNPTCPPKLWGWVMFEAGVNRVKLNVIKQLPIAGITASASKFTDSSQLCTELPEDSFGETGEQEVTGMESSPLTESVHVHFVDQSLKSALSGTVGGQSSLSLVHDTSLHATQGELSVGLVWINVPSPSSQNSNASAIRHWNLLSSASVSVNCWLDPADRLTGALKKFQDEVLQRHCAVAACVLTEALENLNVTEDGPEKTMEPMKHRYNVLTRKAMCLRKDPNFLLCHELQRFLCDEAARQVVFAAVGPTNIDKRPVPPLPALSTLKKGVSALVRQWTSRYAGVIASVQHTSRLKKSHSDSPVNGILRLGVEAKDAETEELSKESVSFHRTALVVEASIPGETEPLHDDATPRKKLLGKSDTFNSLSAIEEGVSLKSGIGAEESSRERISHGTEPLFQKRMSNMTATEELVYEQQQSMYSWMLNAAKSNSPTQTMAPGGTSPSDVEVHIEGTAETSDKKTDEQKNGATSPRSAEASPQRSDARASRQPLGTKQFTDYEEAFEILLRNIGIQSDTMAQKTDNNGSFVGTECLGSLSVAANLKELRVEKQDADSLYTFEGISRRKRRSAKTRKQRSFFSSLEHAREPRNTGGLNASTWPHIALAAMQTAPRVNPPILVCRDLALKSSMKESEAENKEGTKWSSVQARSLLGASVQNFSAKNKSTLKVGVELSVSSIVQHVDIALLRLVHQLAQISDSVKQAQMDIQVNKYTEGSVSPDIKVLHRRTESTVSSGSAGATSLKRVSSVDHAGNRGSTATVPESDDDADTTSTTSTEVPHCWQVMYKMVDLYNTVPENKTAIIPKDTLHVESEGGVSASDSNIIDSMYRRTTFSFARHDPYVSLVLLAMAKVDKVEMRAAIGDLRLEAEIVNLICSADHKKEVESAIRRMASSEIKTTLGAINVRLADVAKSRAQYKKIATTSVNRSALIANTDHRRNSDKNVCRLELGLINFDLSQHPASLHDVVSRGSRQLSMHITEFVHTPTVRQMHEYDVPDAATPYVPATPVPSSTIAAPMTPITPSALTTLIDLSQDSSSVANSTPVTARFELASDGIKVVASLLPSLRAQYETGKICGEGRTGLDATFSISMPEHFLQFTTVRTPQNAHYNQQDATIIELPEINIEGEYKQQAEGDEKSPFSSSWEGQNTEASSSNLQLRAGNYLCVWVKIGSFEHSLTTDLLNQLVFLQEVFVKEMNDMFDKVSKSNRPVALWSETSLRSEESTSEKPLLYQLKLTLQGIQITAATPSCNAVRLKTGKMMFELSNRVIQNKHTKKKRKKGLNVPNYLKLFGKAQVDLTLSLGTLVRNAVYPEAEDEFQQLAYFTTRIGLQNTRQEKGEASFGHGSPTTFASTGSPSASASTSTRAPTDFLDSDSLRTHASQESSDNSVILISLKRPIFFIQPTAFDKAILVYLSYKTAYDDWKEQQENVWKMARQMRDVLHSTRSQTSSMMSSAKFGQQRNSTVFLQLSVNDLGICLPVTQNVQLHEVTARDELSSALVLTIDNTLISAYYARSLVTKGHLKGFCLRFADDFQPSWDDWKQDLVSGSNVGLPGNTAIMNACVVPEGTYEICSDTTTHHMQPGTPPIAKTTVNVLWKMMGVDVNMDTKIGSYFSRLTDTLMAITGQDEPIYDDDLDIQTSHTEEEDGAPGDEDEPDSARRSRSTTVTSTISSSSVTLRMQKEKTRKIEHELNEQVKVVNDLRQLGAKKTVIEEEERRMHELESALSSNFRRVVRTRLRRSSVKAGSRKESNASKYRPTHKRAKSATTFPSGPSAIPPRPSHSARSSLPRELKQDDWTGRRPDDSARNHSTGFSISPKHPSPLLYTSDGVFSPSPDQRDADDQEHAPDDFDGAKDSSTSDEEKATDDVPDFGLTTVRPDSANLKNPDVRRTLYTDRQSGFVPPAPRLPTSKSDSHLAGMSQVTPGPEVDLQLALDVRVEVDGGKIECHPYPQEVEVSIRTDYGVMPPSYNKPKTGNFVKNTTIFYIPAVEVKLHYKSSLSEVTGPKEDNADPLIEGRESAAETPEYITPPLSSQRNASKVESLNEKKHIPQRIDEDSVLVPEIEITTPSHFAKKEKTFFPPDAAQPLGRKRACVYARLAMQSLPEMVISPYLLDFLEQTLSEIETMSAPSQSSQKHSRASSNLESPFDSFACSEDDFGSDPSEVGEEVLAEGSMMSSESPLVSLPLDVVVSVNVQPSQVRFNCVPLSRVECLFQIPGMDLVFSSVQDDTDWSMMASGNLSESVNKKNKQSGGKLESGQSVDSSTSNAPLRFSSGLSFSAILSDFSVYVFHPYGGKQPAGNFPLDMTTSFMGSPTPGSSDSPFQKSGSGRRDSLSVNLEFVKINLVRRKKGETILLTEVSSPTGRNRVDNVIIHLSGLVDIGKASFKYDMRRLGEILSFPRAWYRRSIARRLFLGDTNEQLQQSQSTPPPRRQKDLRRPQVTTKASQSRSRTHTNPVASDSSILSFFAVDTPLSPQQRPMTPRGSRHHGRRFSPSSTSTHGKTGNEGVPPGAAPGDAFVPVQCQWCATVLLGLNMSRLDVEMNMSNVMGNTVWSCDALRSQGRLTFHSGGDKDILLTCSLNSSQLTARGGIIGGQVELKGFSADCRLSDPAEGDPLHKLSLCALSLDGRIEYMGGTAMLGQLTHVDLQLRDEWRDPVQSIPSSMDKGTVYVHCDLGWRVFQLSISRSTTPDVIKMLSKLEEFFSQQLHSSVRAISSWTESHPRPVSPKKVHGPMDENHEKVEYDHRRHWPPVFKAVYEAIAKARMSDTQKHLQTRSFLLGGSACLHGDGLVVVCFHGANFRARTWVLFNLLQPNIVFSTEVQQIKESVSGDETSTLAIQSLTVNLGHDLWLSRTVRATDPMATVSRVTQSRNQNPPPGSAPISEWFAYMTASHNEELKMLRTLNDIGAGGGGGSQGAASNTGKASTFGNRFTESTSGASYSHEADIIFALPKVQLDFKTEHMQGPVEPDPEDPDNKPVVECSFVTEFTDHICVTMDVELILFLHDLVSSYLKEKQQSLSSRTKLATLSTNQWGSMDGSFTSERKLSLPVVDPIDLREFVCNTWQLEPTVREVKEMKLAYLYIHDFHGPPLSEGSMTRLCHGSLGEISNRNLTAHNGSKATCCWQLESQRFVSLISWAGRRIEPVGVDYILHKLGFQHARTTIPKWFQRGILDPLDKGLATIVRKLVVTIISRQKQDEKAADFYPE